ncbi:MAG TPA: hypothetical protein VGE82_01205 [Nitrososphaera sp.]
MNPSEAAGNWGTHFVTHNKNSVGAVYIESSNEADLPEEDNLDEVAQANNLRH